jgi:hypothetical protein
MKHHSSFGLVLNAGGKKSLQENLAEEILDFFEIQGY